MGRLQLYVMVDMEGISGIYRNAQVRAGADRTAGLHSLPCHRRRPTVHRNPPGTPAR